MGESRFKLKEIARAVLGGLLIVAIILCGASLTFIFGAAVAVSHKTIRWWMPVYGEITNYLETADFAWLVMGAAGCSFVLALFLMLVVAIRKMQAEAASSLVEMHDASG